LKGSDRILAINDRLRDNVVQLGAVAQRTIVLRAGIDTARFDPVKCYDRGEVRRRYGLGKEDLVLFFMGWLYHFSGLKEVALCLSQTREDNFKLLIVGDGDAYDDLLHIQKKYNLKDRMTLLGKQPYAEIPRLVNAADICILPAYANEPIMQNIIPIKLYEYMGMKKPVISTCLPGVMKEFGENNGVVYVTGPSNVIAKAFELVQSHRIEELGAKARKFVEKWSWNGITDEFEQILKETIKEKANERLSKQIR